MHPGSRPSLRHVPALDGIRGAAVAGILLFHAGHLRGGWLGVDLFFVLSGFLISSLLLIEYADTGSISLRAFWGRRARRLLPALFAALVGVAAYAAFFAAPDELPRIRADGLATLFYVANWHSVVAETDYWSLFRNPSPLEHSWSLAIEEQFYLAWPPLFLLLARRLRGSAGSLGVVALALAVASATWMALLFDERQGTARVYFGTDTRAAAVLLGAALAACVRGARPRSPLAHRGLDMLGLVSAAGLAWGWLGTHGELPWLYRGGLFLFEAMATGVIAAAVLAERGIVSRMFSWEPLRWLGLISYGLYLWHWPVYVTLSPERTGLEGWLLTSLRIGVSGAIATASYRWLELPVRRGGIAPRTALAAGAFSAAVAAALLLATTRLPIRSASAGTPVASVDPDAPVVLIVGDSLAARLDPLFQTISGRGAPRVVTRAGGGCTALEATRVRFRSGKVVLLGYCDQVRAQWAKDVSELDPALVIVLEGWPGLGAKEIRGGWHHPCESILDEAHAEDLEATVRQLQRGGRLVAVVASAPPQVIDAPDYLTGGPGADLAPLAELARRRMDCQNAVRRRVAERSGAILIDLDGELCPGGACRRMQDGALLREDGVHFAEPGGFPIATWLLDQFAAHISAPVPADRVR
ncbi:MAG: acyltransferase family protein [Myxococcota bacterium]